MKNHKIKIGLSIIFSGLYLFLNAQDQKKIDSLWNELGKSKHDTEKVKVYKEISWELIYVFPDSSISILNKALVISNKHKYATGNIYCLNGLARAYWIKGEYPTSMNHAISCIRICDSIGNKIEKVRSLNMLGLIYYEMSDYDKAIDNYNSALHLEYQIKDSTLLSRILGNIGDIYLYKNDTAKALSYYKKALKISRSRQDKMNSSTNYLALGGIFREQKKIAKAEFCLKESLRLAEEVNDNQNASQCLSGLSKLYLKSGENDKCIEYGKRALNVAKSLNDLPSVYESAQILYEAYNKNQNFKEALNYYLIADNADDSMFNSYKNDEVNKLQHSFDIEKQKDEIKILSKDKKLAELKSVLFGSGFILLLILGIVIFRSRQKAYKAKILLEKQKKEIEDKNEHLNQKNAEIGAQRDEIETQRDFVTKQKEHIEHIHNELTGSIRYAERIQTAVLPDEKFIRNNIHSDIFILFKPKDIVSGDFYFVEKIKKWLPFAVADCTGHGVPGAFMSMLGISFLNEIISKVEIHTASNILDELRKHVIHSLQQKGIAGEQKDGMDLTFVIINTETYELQYSGAYASIYFISASNNYELRKIKGDKMPVAIHDKMNNFTNHSIQLQKGDIFYLMSDGFEDQFGGPKGRKFFSKNIRQLLQENYKKDMTEQKELLNNTIENWKNNFEIKYEQTDDITVMGIRI